MGPELVQARNAACSVSSMAFEIHLHSCELRPTTAEEHAAHEEVADGDERRLGEADGVADLPALWRLVSANPAAAMGLADRGRIAPGLRADLAIWDAQHPAELSYRIGATPLHARIFGGRLDA